MFCSECGAIAGPGPLDAVRARQCGEAADRAGFLKRLWRSVSGTKSAEHRAAG
jgi:hypothetical protein